ncbi:response regulator transcription factor [Neolewinella aurantiaca]|uniref:Response regulator transcription factor n=1 Tax=Neolewinella aurantiaca TaxID=2602767 RepID=A0A5C7FQC4_9BACT|nr:LytTR family transcriptional regulator DNA-binding domain-containing protein [Neolewinella aurantiaca]TXF88613.1 response regulator transcription factor [Neolewinella aurantiaca]
MTPTVKVLVVEDEMIIAAKISLHLEQLGYEVAGILPRGEEAVLYCRESPPDILLLDVNLKGIIDGVETARVLQLEGIIVPTIFLTANSDQETFDRAKETRPQAFLAKPYRKTDLARAIDLALINSSSAPAAAPREQPEAPHLLNDRIFVRHKDRMVKLFLNEILYVEAERAYCKIVTADTEYLLSIALRKFEEQLTSTDFMRVHRSFLINLTRIDEVAEGHVALAGKAIPIGKTYREAFTGRVNLIR